MADLDAREFLSVFQAPYITRVHGKTQHPDISKSIISFKDDNQ